MAEHAKYAQGEFCWIELSTPDPAGAKRFYAALFGWAPQDAPMPDGSTYTMLSLGQDGVGALYQHSDEMKKMRVPPHWACYVAVTDAAAAAQQAAKLGGRVERDAFDVMEFGRMAVVADPTGGTFCLWQAKQHAGAARFPQGTVGTPCWYELLTPEPGRAAPFYQGLFGWQPQTNDMGAMQYTVFGRGDQQVGGMMEMPAELQKMRVPSHWTVYFHVASCAETAAKAAKLGATVLVPPKKIEDVGTFATLKDPQGAVFAILSA
jgi:hypothetical protein